MKRLTTLTCFLVSQIVKKKPQRQSFWTKILMRLLQWQGVNWDQQLSYLITDQPISYNLIFRVAVETKNPTLIDYFVPYITPNDATFNAYNVCECALLTQNCKIFYDYFHLLSQDEYPNLLLWAARSQALNEFKFLLEHIPPTYNLIFVIDQCCLSNRNIPLLNILLSRLNIDECNYTMISAILKNKQQIVQYMYEHCSPDYILACLFLDSNPLYITQWHQEGVDFFKQLHIDKTVGILHKRLTQSIENTIGQPLGTQKHTRRKI